MSNEIYKLADECYELQKNIKIQTNELEKKKKLLKSMMENNNQKKITHDGYVITNSIYKIKYSSSLAKEFNNTNKDIIAKLLRESLISRTYKLNTLKYQKLKDMKIESDIDQFVTRKKAHSALMIRIK